MNLNVRTQRSIPSRLNAVALTKYTGACVVRKKLRIAGIPVRGFVWTTRLGPDGAIVGSRGPFVQSLSQPAGDPSEGGDPDHPPQPGHAHQCLPRINAPAWAASTPPRNV